MMTGTTYPETGKKLKFILTREAAADCPVQIVACSYTATVAAGAASEWILNALYEYIENEPDQYNVI